MSTAITVLLWAAAVAIGVPFLIWLIALVIGLVVVLKK